MSFTEGSYENALITLYENMGYQHLYGPDIERDYYVPFYEEQVLNSLTTIKIQASHKLPSTRLLPS